MHHHQTTPSFDSGTSSYVIGGLYVLEHDGVPTVELCFDGEPELAGGRRGNPTPTRQTPKPRFRVT